MLALAAAVIDLGSKGIGCDRRPDRFCCRLNELSTRHLDLRRALTEFLRDRVNVRHRPTHPFIRPSAPARAGPTNLRVASPAQRHNATRGGRTATVVESQAQACDRAAAFISFLCARTFCNDSGLVTSATER